MKYSVNPMLGLVGALCVLTGGSEGFAVAGEERGAGCQSLSSESRTTSILEARDVVDVQTVRERVGKQMRWKTTGVEMRIAPKFGDSAVLLERMVRCQLQHERDAKDSNSPLALTNLRVSVRNGGEVFVLRIASEEEETARKIVDRALRIGSGQAVAAR